MDLIDYYAEYGSLETDEFILAPPEEGRCDKHDSLECPECGGCLCFIKAGNAYCEDCGYDAYCLDPPRDNSEWNGLPWDTFEPATESIRLVRREVDLDDPNYVPF